MILTSSPDFLRLDFCRIPHSIPRHFTSHRACLATFFLKPDYLPGLGAAEHNEIYEAVSGLANPSPAKELVAVYPLLSAQIALENGNEKARKHFLSKFPGLKESTVRN